MRYLWLILFLWPQKAPVPCWETCENGPLCITRGCDGGMDARERQ